MKSFTITFALAFILILILSIRNEINSEKHLGESIVVGKDTLIALNWRIDDIYILSNKVEVNGRYFRNHSFKSK